MSTNTISSLASPCDPRTQGQKELVTDCDGNDVDLTGQKPMTAKTACEKTKEIAKNIDAPAILNAFATSLNPVTMVLDGAAKLACAVGSCNKDTQTAWTNLQAAFNNSQKQDSLQNCTNNGIIIQSNYIDGNACPSLLDGKCASLRTDEARMECLKYFAKNPPEPPKVGGKLTQENIAKLQQVCVAGNILYLLSTQSASIQNSALMSAIQESTGLLASNTSEKDICSNIGVSMSSCQYVRSSQCCANQLFAMQTNVTKTCGPGQLSLETIQRNEFDVSQTCLMQSATSMTSDMAAAVSNLVVAASEQKATGLDLNMFAIIMGILVGAFLLMGGGSVYAFKQLGSVVVKVLVGILVVSVLIGGVVLVGVGATSNVVTPAVTESYVYDKPFVRAATTSIRKPDDANSPGTLIGVTFEEAMASVGESVAFDFLVGINDINKNLAEVPAPPDGPAPPATFSDCTSATGSVVYYSSVNANYSSPVEDVTKNRSISYTRGIESSENNPNAWMVPVGAGLIVLDLIAVALLFWYIKKGGMFTSSSNPKNPLKSTQPSKAAGDKSTVATSPSVVTKPPVKPQAISTESSNTSESVGLP